MRAGPALARAKARLDGLDLYPKPVRVDGVRVVVLPLFFRLPKLRRYRGYALWKTILLRDAAASDDLLTHELCHIWQGQHRRWHMLWTYVTTRYDANPYEREAREAVARTRADRGQTPDMSGADASAPPADAHEPPA